ncbi:hypothetical protein C9439_03700 [archaeon SCG-AAA382B04]|nr:hypothetical protein C9439_03700 [archaeon SCG-AAA382B04]
MPRNGEGLEAPYNKDNFEEIKKQRSLLNDKAILDPEATDSEGTIEYGVIYHTRRENTTELDLEDLNQLKTEIEQTFEKLRKLKKGKDIEREINEYIGLYPRNGEKRTPKLGKNPYIVLYEQNHKMTISKQELKQLKQEVEKAIEQMKEEIQKIQCDRCNKQISKPQKIEIGDKEYELCKDCYAEVKAELKIETKGLRGGSE